MNEEHETGNRHSAIRHNPYDFLNPVQDPSTFAGRSSELADIRYYLDLARLSRPMHLAIIGPRASGKTSLLNIVNHEAKERGCCTAQVYLTESDITSELTFFLRLFDAILFSACDEGAFGGLTGNTYLTYRDMVDSYAVPDDKLFCPFVLPIQYANTMRRGRTDATVADMVVSHDIEIVANELNATIVLALDESDVLGLNKALLQRLRSVLQKPQRAMFIFAGTPDMFPVMDDVFSPIARQFKKLRLGPFIQRDEIRDCILNPLKSAGFPNPESLIARETLRELEEINGISGGNPYELQMICHYLYKQYEAGVTATLQFTPEVFENVLVDLENSQDSSRHHLIQEMRTWPKSKLYSLGTLCACNGSATFAQLAWMERFFHDTSDSEIELLKLDLDWLVKHNVVRIDNDVIQFAGDEFERLYSKYMARKMGVSAYVATSTIEIYAAAKLYSAAKSTIGVTGNRVDMHPISRRSQLILHRAVQRLSDWQAAKAFLRDYSLLNLDTYKLCFQNANLGYSSFVNVQLDIEGVSADLAFIRGLNVDICAEQRLMSFLEDMQAKARELGGELSFDRTSVPVSTKEALIAAVCEAASDTFKEQISLWHLFEASVAHSDRGDTKYALLHAEACAKISPTPNSLNNLGYLYIADACFDKAMSTLTLINLDDADIARRAVILHNIGSLAARLGEYDRGLAAFRESAALAAELEETERTCLCLFVPQIPPNSSSIEIVEEFGPDLSDTAQRAIQALESIGA